MHHNTHDVSSATVLIVEDEALIRFDTAEGLRAAGFTVVEASSADEALDYLAAGSSVDVVLTDIRMPGDLNGVNLARIVNERMPSIPVVLTSANRPSDAFDLPFIPKPYLERDVIAALRAALNSRNKTDDEREQHKRGDGG